MKNDILKIKAEIVKNFIDNIFDYQKQLDELLEFLYKNIEIKDLVKDKINEINFLNEEMHSEYYKLLQMCIDMYYDPFDN